MPVFAQISAIIVPYFSNDLLTVTPFPAAVCRRRRKGWSNRSPKRLPVGKFESRPMVRPSSSGSVAECLSRRIRYSAHGWRRRVDHAAVLPTPPSKPLLPEPLETLSDELEFPKTPELSEPPTQVAGVCQGERNCARAGCFLRRDSLNRLV